MPTFRDQLSAIINKHVASAVEDAVAAYRSLMQADGGGRGRGRGGATRAAARKRGRRSSREIEGTVEKVVAFIGKNPGLRSEEIAKKMGGDSGAISDALARLRAGKKVKTKGERRAMTYSL